MFILIVYRFRLFLCCALLTLLCAFPARTQSNGNVRGKVVDPLGSPVANAKIVLFQESREIVQGTSDAEGNFSLSVPASGRYATRVEAPGFATENVPPIFVTSENSEELTVSLRIGPLPQQVVVSATGTAIPDAQVGAAVTLIGSDLIESLNKLDVLENLRFVPGAQIVQTSQRGGTASLFIRGGESDFNKVLVDGIPVNAIGGGFDFAQLSNNGVSSVEVLRGANSVLYGSDALGGVVNITTTRGTTAIPELKYSVDGGNFRTLNQDVSLGGAIHNFDYFSEFSRFDTQGSYPNDFFHNETVSANLGWDIAPTSGIRATVRHTTTDLGAPNGIDLYGISDDSTLRNQSTYVGATAQQQSTERWHNSVQLAFAQFSSLFANPSPTGEPSDPFGSGEPNYLGNLVTIRGANGFSAAGRGILDFGGTYPQFFPDYQARRSVYAQSDYRAFRDWTGSVGFRYEHENGEDLTRNNYSSFLEAHGGVAHRFFVTAGVGLEGNAVFGFAASPRVSLAYYLRRPSVIAFLGDTKLKFNWGKGIKEPSTSQQASALFNILTPEQIAQFSVSPVGPERSKTFDAGVEQRLWKGRAIMGLTYFYNRFYDLIAFLNPSSLESIGVPAGAAEATAIGGGAYVNATSERALGTELEGKIDLGHGLLFQGAYTYLDAVVTKAFAVAAINPLFPNTPIGAFSPLQGARPFHRAPHSGSLVLAYNSRRFNAALSGYLVSRRDDSTFLLDSFFGNTLVLPNRNLAPGYQKFDLSAGYAVTSYAKIYTSIENLLSQHYQAAFGFPAAPFAIRTGITFTIGGHQEWWK
jgi:vitamin B12 transporter